MDAARSGRVPSSGRREQPWAGTLPYATAAHSVWQPQQDAGRERRRRRGMPAIERRPEPFPAPLTPPLASMCWERRRKIAPRARDRRRVRIQEGDLEKRHREGPSRDHKKAGEETGSGLCQYQRWRQEGRKLCYATLKMGARSPLSLTFSRGRRGRTEITSRHFQDGGAVTTRPTF